MTISGSGKITASLLPYLQGGGNGFRFYLSLAGNAQGDGAYPFALLDDSAPYSRVIEATIVTDTGCLLKKVSLQVQKDHYTSGEGFRPVSNLDIEAGWQSAFAGPGGTGQILLASQIDQCGRPLQQAPLFYCREKDVYFHPPCPSCGLPLTLCIDDRYLSENGLSTYAGSSKRYLHCSACCAIGVKEVYAYERDPVDPPNVKDRWGLVDRFGMIDEQPGALDPFPCASCPELGACYGPGKLARSRVAPFSFYPFYLLVSEAPTLHSMEYLPLVAGATPQEVQGLLDPLLDAPRLASLRALTAGSSRELSLFRRGDDRFFLEVLFLKLSLLKEILPETVLFDGNQGMKLARERVWVRLSPGGGSLPLLWSGSATIFNDINPQSSQLGMRKYSSDDIAHLGLAWFNTLLLNRQVNPAQLLDAVVEYISAKRGGSLIPETAGILQQLAVPENALWTPEDRPLSPEWLSFWKRSCAIGFQFLNAAAQPGTSLSGIQVAEDLQLLLAQLKVALFAPPTAKEAVPLATPSREEVPCQCAPAQAAPPLEAPRQEALPREAQHLEAPHQEAPAAPSCDALLKDVVAELIRNCRAELQQRPVPPAPLPGEVDEDEVATVIITARPPAPAVLRYEPGEDDMITETVVLSSHPTPRPVQPAPRPVPEADALMETMVLNAPRPGRVPEPPPAPVPESDALAETMVMNAPRAAQQWQQSPHVPAPQPAAPQYAPPRPPVDEADELGETMVITPNRDKPRR